MSSSTASATVILTTDMLPPVSIARFESVDNLWTALQRAVPPVENIGWPSPNPSIACWLVDGGGTTVMGLTSTNAGSSTIHSPYYSYEDAQHMIDNSVLLTVPNRRLP